jgi:hypothetical protein
LLNEERGLQQPNRKNFIRRIFPVLGPGLNTGLG